jgi:hypothetical protein
MENQNVNLKTFGAQVQVTPGGAVYVTITGTTVYFENGSCGLSLSLWTEDMETDQSIDLVECMEDCQNKGILAELAKLKAENERLKKEAETSIYWAPEDLDQILDTKKFSDIKLSDIQKAEIVQTAVKFHSPDYGLNWEILETFMYDYLKVKGLLPDRLSS